MAEVMGGGVAVVVVDDVVVVVPEDDVFSTSFHWATCAT